MMMILTRQHSRCVPEQIRFPSESLQPLVLPERSPSPECLQKQVLIQPVVEQLWRFCCGCTCRTTLQEQASSRTRTGTFGSLLILIKTTAQGWKMQSLPPEASVSGQRRASPCGICAWRFSSFNCLSLLLPKRASGMSVEYSAAMHCSLISAGSCCWNTQNMWQATWSKHQSGQGA